MHYISGIMARRLILALLVVTVCLMLVALHLEDATVTTRSFNVISASFWTLEGDRRTRFPTKTSLESASPPFVPDFMQETANWPSPRRTTDRYLVYLCDGNVHCYGLADRERGMVLVYVMALLTGRKFGILMTSPAPLQDYYVPHHVNWTVSESDVTGKSRTVVSLLGPERMDLRAVDFNKAYPQDVVFVRTNHDLSAHSLSPDHHYRYTFPAWNTTVQRKIFAQVWVALFTPSVSLRHQLNAILVDIARTMNQEVVLHRAMRTNRCVRTCEIGLGLNSGETTRNVTQLRYLQTQARGCVRNLKDVISDVTSDIFNGEYRNMMLKIINDNEEEKEEEGEGQNDEEGSKPGKEKDNNIVTMLQKTLCTMNTPLKPKYSLDAIWAARGYDFVDLDLVCVHIRLGHSSTMPWERRVRNTLEDTDAVWDFLKPYVRDGYHVFLASDSEQVRLKGKEMFGAKLHVSKDPVIHIDMVKGDQDERRGLQLALTEQLLLMTSCQTLVISKSGFSQRAAMIRRHVMDLGNVFKFRQGEVLPWDVRF